MESLLAIRNPACVMRFWSSYFVALTALSMSSCQVDGESVTPASSRRAGLTSMEPFSRLYSFGIP